jgi:hypothetical protein
MWVWFDFCSLVQESIGNEACPLSVQATNGREERQSRGYVVNFDITSISVQCFLRSFFADRAEVRTQLFVSFNLSLCAMYNHIMWFPSLSFSPSFLLRSLSLVRVHVCAPMSSLYIQTQIECVDVNLPDCLVTLSFFSFSSRRRRRACRTYVKAYPADSKIE